MIIIAVGIMLWLFLPFLIFGLSEKTTEEEIWKLQDRITELVIENQMLSVEAQTEETVQQKSTFQGNINLF